WTTTFDDNFNAGYATSTYCNPSCPSSLFLNAPTPVSNTDETQGAQSPFQNWNYNDGYTIYLDKATVDIAYAGVSGGFFPAGSTNANWTAPFQHNSPSKPAPTCPTGGGGGGATNTKATVAGSVKVTTGTSATTGSITFTSGAQYLVLASTE